MKILILIFTLVISTVARAQSVKHHLDVRLKPSISQLRVLDIITVPNELCQQEKMVFYLHKGLHPKSLKKSVSVKKLADHAWAVPVESFQVTLSKDSCTFSLSYKGVIKHPVKEDKSPGTIGTQGVMLGTEAYWYPMFDNQLVSFTLNVKVPSPWKVVSQGVLNHSSTNNGNNVFSWQEKKPQDAIYLIAADFHYYEQPDTKVKVDAYLRTADKALAEKYLQMTSSYIELYEDMIGPYPYAKFSLVENFWGSGYGMPSFTLLGDKVIRLPFILYTSYPHEVLHNWWGNGVYIDISTGNWTEGLTSYLADHYFKEQRSKGHIYRRTALQNFSSYVDDSNDFPISEFTASYDKVSSAIGYGKVLMFFHMLRKQLGDDVFFKSIKHFYANNLFKLSGYKQIQSSFETISGKSLEDIFSQWVYSKGAPKLILRDTAVASVGHKWKLKFSLAQEQEGMKYKLFIPYKVTLEDGTVEEGQLSLFNKSTSYELKFSQPPKSLSIDPDFDVFRHLYEGEVPPVLSETFGENKALAMILPSASEQLAKYKIFAQSIQSHYEIPINIIEDHKWDQLPTKGTLWFLGWNSKFNSKIKCLFQKAGSDFSLDKVKVMNSEYRKEEFSFFAALGEQLDTTHSCVGHATKQPIMWTGLSPTSDPETLSNKIYHYGGYSHLAFDLDHVNKLKGHWEGSSSPLKVNF
ncbi:MAG: hypothetical protein HOO06_15715 [Bdellovibrionaceae bacterium]|nr:hypothetical protein [Pseudobdellovibrionaceae bacterium]